MASERCRFKNGENEQPAPPPPSTNGTNGPAPAPSTNGENGDSPGTNGRDEGGRFAKGNPGGPGNPFARAVGARRRALLDAISPEDVARIARKLCEQALAGNSRAAKVLLPYIIGTPGPAADPDRLDLDELRLLRQSPNVSEMMEVLSRIAPALAVELAAEKLATDRDGYKRLLIAGIERLERQLLGRPGGLDTLVDLDDDLDAEE